MNRIVDWYWKYGVKRPVQWSLTLSSLDSIMGIANRRRAISRARDSENGKGCVAFWGPSQSGKSSLLAHYIDGDGDENLALMWNQRQRVRFAADQNGRDNDADCVVFNPFNGGMDASGLVTRFYLPTAAERDVIDPNAPVEILLANRKQVLHALAVGTRMECQESENPWGLVELRKRIATPSRAPKREAFEFLFDVCDVCENMARELARYREFSNGHKLRQQILGSDCVDDVEAALELAAYLLWDGERQLTVLYKSIMHVYGMVEDLCRNSSIPHRFFASMEVAALLEDIGVVSFYEQNKKSASVNAGTLRRVKSFENLRMHVTPRGIVCSCDATKPADAIKTESISTPLVFGCLQALIGELRIPLHRNENPTARPFFAFLEKCDLLDIPGVTNKAAGESLGRQNLLDLQKDISSEELLSRVYKTGKTLSVVYGQTENCSIDSFVIFADLERSGGLSRPAPLTNGIKAWLSPYGFSSFTERLPLRLYFNCSLFGKLMNTVVAAVNGGGLGTYCEKAATLEFVTAHDVECFFTTNRFAPCEGNELKHYFEEDPSFREMFLRGAGPESLNALFADGLGTDYMFTRLAQDVSPQTRLSHYALIEQKDRSKLRNELSRILPSNQNEVAKLRQTVARHVSARIAQNVSEREPSQVRRLCAFVKRLFEIDALSFEPIPREPHHMHDEDLKIYLLRQIQKWISSRKGDLVGTSEFNWLVEDDEADLFLEALATIPMDRIVRLLKTDFWNHDPNVSRPFLAMALANCFLWGDYERHAREERHDAYGMLCAPFIARLENLATMTTVSSDGRPMDLEGDAELLEIARDLTLT